MVAAPVRHLNFILMVDIELFRQILSNENPGYIAPGDCLNKEIIELFSLYSKDAVMPLFKPIPDGVRFTYFIEQKCPSCGEYFYARKTKDAIFRYIKNPTAKKYQCPNCRYGIKDSETKIDKSSEVYKHSHDMLMNLYLECCLGPGYFIESSLKGRLKVLLNPDVEYDRVKKRILSMDYQDFLRTPYWATVAEMVRKRDNYKCQECGSMENLNVHHKTYENHGDEIHHIEDLICLCQKCHEKHHAK